MGLSGENSLRSRRQLFQTPGYSLTYKLTVFAILRKLCLGCMICNIYDCLSSQLASFEIYFRAEFSQKQLFHYLDTLLLVYMESTDLSLSPKVHVYFSFLGQYT